jgi:large subunit ribosomal protein L25
MHWCETRWRFNKSHPKRIRNNILPQDLPEFIEVDLENLELGNSIHISQISLPKGVKSLLSQKTSEDPAVVAVQAPKVVADPVEKEAESPDTPDTTAENKESSDSDPKKEDAKE